MEPDFKFELLPLHSPLLRQSLLVSFHPLIDMLKFSGFQLLNSGYLSSNVTQNIHWNGNAIDNEHDIPRLCVMRARLLASGISPRKAGLRYSCKETSRIH